MFMVMGVAADGRDAMARKGQGIRTKALSLVVHDHVVAGKTVRGQLYEPGLDKPPEGAMERRLRHIFEKLMQPQIARRETAVGIGYVPAGVIQIPFQPVQISQSKIIFQHDQIMPQFRQCGQNVAFRTSVRIWHHAGHASTWRAASA
ncbi:MAG: hypothetical protein JJT81_01670 [Rubellimicrobium sp.]|nr:hypothetical protein [Rubellimicrobium sp.]